MACEFSVAVWQSFCELLYTYLTLPLLYLNRVATLPYEIIKSEITTEYLLTLSNLMDFI